jgi:hypothetical protein
MQSRFPNINRTSAAWLWMLGLLLVAALAGPVTALDRKLVYTAQQTVQGFGDWNGDGRLDVVLIDEEEGTYQIGLQQADGTLSWQQSRPTGIVDPTHLSVHRVTDPMRDQMVVTGLTSNRVNVISPGAGSQPQPLSLLPQGIGPVSATAIPVPRAGHDPDWADVIVHTTVNNGSPRTAIEFFQSTASGVAADGVMQATNALAIQRGGRVTTLVGGPEYYAGFVRSGGSSNFLVMTPTASLPLTFTSVSGLPAQARQVHAPLRADLPGREVFVFFSEYEATLRISVAQADGQLGAPVLRTLGGYGGVQALTVTRTTAGYGLFVIRGYGSEGVFITLDENNNLIEGDLVTPAEGDLPLSYAFGYGENEMALMERDWQTGRTKMNHFRHDGTQWNDLGATLLPPRGSAVGLGNVLVYDAEPLVNDGARLLRLLQVPDWTSSAVVSGGSGVSVMREVFGGVSTGLTASGTTILPGVPGAVHALANQVRTDVSLTTFDRTVGHKTPRVELTPPPGVYRTHVIPKLRVSSGHPVADVRAFYRFTLMQEWTEFDLESPTATINLPFPTSGGQQVIRFFAESRSTGERSPETSETYSFSEATTKRVSGADGVPDFVKLAFGVDSFADLDNDGDGFSDLEELLAGADALNPLSRPAENQRLGAEHQVNVRIRPMAHTGAEGGTASLPAWPAFSSPGVSQDDHPATPIRAYGLDGQLLGSAVTTNHPGEVAFNPHALIEKVRSGERDGFMVVSTPRTWQADAGSQSLSRLSPELVALVPYPRLDPIRIDWNYSSSLGLMGNANGWLNAYRAALLDRGVPEMRQSVDYRDTVELLLVERLLARRASLRMMLPKEKLSLTGFRDPVPPAPSSTESWLGNFYLTEEELLSLTLPHANDPAVLPQAVLTAVRDHLRDSGTAAALAFNKLASEFHRLFVGDDGANPGVFGNPFDHLRTIVQELPAEVGDADGLIVLPGDPDELGYANKISLNGAEMAAAELILIELLALPMNRPTGVFIGNFNKKSSWNPHPSIYDDEDNVRYLKRADGSDYLIGNGVPLMDEAKLRVVAFVDRFELPDLEVVSIELLDVPTPGIKDDNEDLMDDDLQNFWFFAETISPWGDEDGDGYSNFQELLDGTNPTLASSFGEQPRLLHGPPMARISNLGAGALRLEVDFPAVYADRVGLGLEVSENLMPFHPTYEEASPVGLDVHRIDVMRDIERAREFYRFRVFLRTDDGGPGL